VRIKKSLASAVSQGTMDLQVIVVDTEYGVRLVMMAPLVCLDPLDLLVHLDRRHSSTSIPGQCRILRKLVEQ